MSSGQSARNGSSVEPGLPKTFLMPKARSRSKVACLTVTVLVVSLVCLRDTSGSSLFVLASEAKQSRIFPRMRSGLLRRFACRNDGSPRRRPLHSRLTLGVGGPELEATAIVVGIDGELGAFEQRLHAAIAQLFRRRAAVQFGGKLDDERSLQRTMEDQPGIAFDLGDVVAVVMDAVTVEGQRRITKQQHRIGHVGFALLRDRRGGGGLA